MINYDDLKNEILFLLEFTRSYNPKKYQKEMPNIFEIIAERGCKTEIKQNDEVCYFEYDWDCEDCPVYIKGNQNE